MYYKHGWFGTPLYNAWAAMKRRCNNPNHEFYRLYGGRGVKVCVEWNEFEPFLDWALKNGYKEGLTLDRTDNDGGYFPENCRWVSCAVQANNRGNNRMIEYNGVVKNLSEWAVFLGIDRRTLRARIFALKWPLDRAFTEPVGFVNGRRSC